MTDVVVIVPVLNRPARALPLAESLLGSAGELTLELVFVLSSSDSDEQHDACAEACRHVNNSSMSDYVGAARIVAPWPVTRGDYARKTNLALWSTNASYLLCAADDVRFGPRWADHAVAAAKATGKCFVATNDLSNPLVKAGEHATHPLVCREYALECGTVDTPGLIYHEGYWHQYVDNEATATAKWRDCFAFAPDAVVEHVHPIFPKPGEPRVLVDSTYELGRRHAGEDRALWLERQERFGL